jgi:antitoxin component YwqK of YwqJK toxin-antitoxin module
MKFVVIILSLFFCACTGNKEVVLETWSNNNVKAKKVYYNDRDTTQFLSLTYYPSGKTKERTHYQSKIKNGWSITYYDNGQVKDSIFYRNNIPSTTSLSFYSNGGVAISGSYDDLGNKIGWWTFYDSLGVIIKATEFTSNMEQTKNFSF